MGKRRLRCLRANNVTDLRGNIDVIFQDLVGLIEVLVSGRGEGTISPFNGSNAWIALLPRSSRNGRV